MPRKGGDGDPQSDTRLGGVLLFIKINQKIPLPYGVVDGVKAAVGSGIAGIVSTIG